MSGYVPKPSDQEWTRGFLSMVADGAIWVTSFAVYTVDKSHKTLRVQEVLPDGVSVAPMERVAAVFKSIGWEVVE